MRATAVGVGELKSVRLDSAKAVVVARAPTPSPVYGAVAGRVYKGWPLTFSATICRILATGMWVRGRSRQAVSFVPHPPTAAIGVLHLLRTLMPPLEVVHESPERLLYERRSGRTCSPGKRAHIQRMLWAGSSGGCRMSRSRGRHHLATTTIEPRWCMYIM